MKKVLLFFLAIIILSLHVHAIFANGQTDQVISDEFQNEKQIIQQLFQKRANLWNSLYETPKDIKDYGIELQRITTEPLFTFDLESFRDAIEYPHDLEKVIDVKVLDIDGVEYGNTSLKVEATILWRMQGLDSNYEQEINYVITLKKEEAIWKLSDYTISQ
ncbi:hypothetical protein HNQ80_001732 [Anaerosolibacter carboniphilus]|uniref:DUF4829 domain-containing protein n=1 Tax=Anaerosolibacter carboniphilus TaxID=1417629 RepID=A0A841KQF0_9FIRM|nr:hypothetical protein [Anaerosolibacter carboniphilus]MBB6215643.1 hypothetical protein [Anaerosolibacter carboniphilus]